MLHKLRHAAPLATLLFPALAAEARAEEQSAARFDMAYTADIMSNLDGGMETGTRYLDNLEVSLELDAARAFGWNGATIFVNGVYNNGKGFTDSLVGDAQGTSNIEAEVQAARLLEAWVDQRFWNDRASLRAGLYDLNSEFDAIESAEIFLNAGQEMSFTLVQSGENGPSVFPYTALALRGAVNLGENLIVRAAVLDGVPGDPDHPKRTAIKLGDGDGALLVGEVEYAAEGFRAAAGYWRYTARFEGLETGLPRRGNDGLYALVEGDLYEDPEDPRRGLALFARAGWGSAGINDFKHAFAAGGVYTGALPSRPEDKLGLAVAWVEAGAPYRRTAASDKREVAIELTYRAEISENLAIQPDLQYVINPGLAPELDNAFVVGLRLELAWGAGL